MAYGLQNKKVGLIKKGKEMKVIDAPIVKSLQEVDQHRKILNLVNVKINLSNFWDLPRHRNSGYKGSYIKYIGEGGAKGFTNFSKKNS